VTEQVPPAGTPDLAPQQGTSSGSGARAGSGRQSRAPRSSSASRSGRQRAPRAAESADVIVVGAGPAGSAASYHLAAAGLDVLVLEKSSFPREKVCGDGLTPRAVKALTTMGVPFPEGDGWHRHRGLRIIGGGGRIELDWPDLSAYPGYGLVRTRTDFDQLLARHAEKAGARVLEGVNVDSPVLDDRTGRIIGVTTKQGQQFRAPLVVAADGNSSRLSVAMGLHKRDDRPLGVAVRTYYTSPRHDDDYLEAWLDLWDGSALLPGYGWIFGMGDGTSNVGLGLLNTSTGFGEIDYRVLLRKWLAAMPAEWGFTEENRTQPVRGAALPMGFNRTPHYTRGMLLAGDSGGMVNPFNGEGIAYALESGELAARVITQALARPTADARERVLQTYPQQLKDAYGGYYTLGRVFVELIGRPGFMRFATKHGVKRPAIMRFTMKLLGNLTETRGGDAVDRLINAVSKMTPAA
jgi:geranylgeranyl reductase family protein